MDERSVYVAADASEVQIKWGGAYIRLDVREWMQFVDMVDLADEQLRLFRADMINARRITSPDRGIVK